MIDVRDADVGDIAALTAIYNDVVATSTAIYRDTPASLDDRREWWASRVAQHYPVLVALQTGELVGFATFGDFRTWPGYRFTVEHSVHVRGDMRGRGVGRTLMRPLIARAAAAGKHVMVAGVDATNEGSIRFHAQLGFERVAHLREVGFKFGRWLDLVLMQRFLGPADVSELPPEPGHPFPP